MPLPPWTADSGSITADTGQATADGYIVPPGSWTADDGFVTADDAYALADGTLLVPPPPPPPVNTNPCGCAYPGLPTVIAPPQDTGGLQLQAAVVAAQNATLIASPFTLISQCALVNQLQVEVVDHFMATGWLNAAAILALYQPPSGDRVGQALAARVAFLQNLYDNAPAPLPGNASGYGSSGWVTVAQNYQQQLYAAQITLVEHIMDVPGGTPASTILGTMTGFQSFPFEYVFNSVGFTDAWIDG